MNHYKAPLDSMNFILFDVLQAGKLSDYKQFEDATEETFKAVIEEASKLAEQVLEPINATGDREGCQYDPENHSVKTPSGFKEAYQTYREGGWSGLSASPEYGGQGLPHLMKMVVDEMVCSTNLSFGMYPGLSHGAIDALTVHADQALKDQYLSALIEGRWTGTMCLTEPHCGTDLGLIKTKASPVADGSYDITGTKIWITGGEHDLVDNIIHLVLAKLPDAPEGSKGISLFVVPKFLPDGARNPVFCGGLEHKMGINGSATCVMNFEGAKGWLVGEPNQGLKCMFTMMNAARIMVGMQGLGIAETTYQVSLGFAKDRLQSRSITGPVNTDGPADPIIVHPDVRRMLLRQKVVIEGARALAYLTGYHLDLSHVESDETKREFSDDIVQILTPVVKAFLTEEGYFCADQALQSMGGAGFTQDWPVEQFLRDSRIARIYEGTNGIQALDLVGRKLVLKGGRLVRSYFTLLDQLLSEVESEEHKEKAKSFMGCLQKALSWLASNALKDPEQAAAVATPILRLFALTTVSVLWAKIASTASASETENKYAPEFLTSKTKCASHFYRLFEPEARALLEDIQSGKESITNLAVGEF